MKKIASILLFLVCGTWYGCADNEVLVPALSFYNDNVLLPTISFTTAKETEVYILYWPSVAPANRQQSRTSIGVSHSLTLINLKPSTKYHYEIHSVTNGNKSEVFSFMTSVLPAEMLKITKTRIDTTQFNGYVLVRKIGASSADVIIDKEGDVVWYHQYDTMVRRPFIWTQNNTILSSFDTARIVEYDRLGNSLMDIDLESVGVPNSIHHEVILNNQDEMVAITLDSVRMDLRKIGGKQDQFIRADGIIRMSKEGKKIWEWNLLDVYDPIKSFTGNFDPHQSLGHANSLTIDKDGHYLISFRDFSQIWKINSVDGSVLWKLGKDGDFKMNNYFIAQHSIYFNNAGELMMFDNGDKDKRSNSRILSFALDEEKMEAREGIHVALPMELTAYKMCSAERIDDGKYLVCISSKNGIIAIVNDDANILWRTDLSHPSYRAYYISNPFSGLVEAVKN